MKAFVLLLALALLARPCAEHVNVHPHLHNHEAVACRQ